MRQLLKFLCSFIIAFALLFKVSSYFRYTIVIDAGSTGTRFHLYRYLESWLWMPEPFIKEVYLGKIEGGLSGFANHPSQAGPYLKPKLDEILKILKHYSVDPATVHINVLGTAGMRQLSDAEQHLIYNTLINYLKQYYPFKLKGAYIRTIKGQNEGLFAWIDVNYLKNRFVFFRKTVGMLDMGGQSTQYTIGIPVGIKTQHVTKLVKVNYKKYLVLSKTFLGYGLEEMGNRLKADEEGVYCYPKGLEYGHRVGQFDLDKCSKLFNQYLAREPDLQDLPAHHDLKYAAVGGFYYTLNFFDYRSNISDYRLKKQVLGICSLDWQAMKNRYPLQIKLEDQCANMVYIYVLLKNYYHIKFNQLKIYKEFEGRETSWTRGALIYLLENPH